MATQTPLSDHRSVMKRSTNEKNRVVAAMATWEFGTLAVEECVSLLQQEGRYALHIMTLPLSSNHQEWMSAH